MVKKRLNVNWLWPWLNWKNFKAPDYYIVGQNKERFEYADVPENIVFGQERAGWLYEFGGEWTLFHRVGVERSGRMLDGVIHNEFPTLMSLNNL
jgi:hypothetical protein